MWPYPQFAVDLVTFTEEILNKKLHFLCSVWRVQNVDRILIYYKTSGFLPDHFFKKIFQILTLPKIFTTRKNHERDVFIFEYIYLNPSSPTPQNGQTHIV